MPSPRAQRGIFLTAAVLVAAAFVLSICVGKYPLSPGEILRLLGGRDVGAMKEGVFWTLRLPRTVMALLAGLGLGMAGSVYQTIFKNPLASPDLIGVANGANLGAAVAIVLVGYRTPVVAASAFAGGMLVLALLVVVVRATGSGTTTTYILAGIILKALSEACIMLLKFFADPQKELAAIEFWSMGSLGNITAAKLAAIAPIFLAGFLGLVVMRRQVALLGLEEEESRMLGVRVGLVRMGVLALSTLAVTSIICVTGLIGFVGLIAPHIARLALRRVSFASGALASLAGAFVLLVADTLARSLHSAEIPISILTTLIGVPFLVYFMRSRRAGRI